MPGSPPISTTPPGTSPPPSTRSNSVTPVDSRGSSAAAISPSVCTSAVGAMDAKRAEGELSDGASASVFHAPHCGHCPCHFGLVPPHSPQTYCDFALAMSVDLAHRHAGRQRAQQFVADGAAALGNLVDR